MCVLAPCMLPHCLLTNCCQHAKWGCCALQQCDAWNVLMMPNGKLLGSWGVSASSGSCCQLQWHEWENVTPTMMLDGVWQDKQEWCVTDWVCVPMWMNNAMWPLLSCQLGLVQQQECAPKWWAQLCQQLDHWPVSMLLPRGECEMVCNEKWVLLPVSPNECAMTGPCQWANVGMWNPATNEEMSVPCWKVLRWAMPAELVVLCGFGGARWVAMKWCVQWNVQGESKSSKSQASVNRVWPKYTFV